MPLDYSKEILRVRINFKIWGIQYFRSSPVKIMTLLGLGFTLIGFNPYCANHSMFNLRTL